MKARLLYHRHCKARARQVDCHQSSRYTLFLQLLIDIQKNYFSMSREQRAAFPA
jgi:hypothetical protein